MIIGMGPIGRTIADALMEFEISYVAVEKDQKTFAEANADGYTVVFGDGPIPASGSRSLCMIAKSSSTTNPRS